MDDRIAGDAQRQAKAAKGGPRRAAMPKTGDLTLHQLRIFWAVARSPTLTGASKQLGLAQPSLSQQLAKLEANVGTLLFHRRSNELELTEAGTYLLSRVEHVLRSITELEDGLDQFRSGQKVTLRIAGLNSVLRALLPGAVAGMQAHFPGIDFDILESAPTDIVDLLYSRRVIVGLLAANSIAEAGNGFTQIPLLDDPYVLAVPAALDLDGVADPAQLPAELRSILNQSIQFTFGSRHTSRVADWYERMLPQHRTVAQCRSFETAIELVRAGVGVCLSPALATMGPNGGAGQGVRLYRVKAPPRRIVALVPSQYRYEEPYAHLLSLLERGARDFTMPEVRPTPPWLAAGTSEDL